MITYVHTKNLYPTVYSGFILIAPGWKQLKFPYVREQKKMYIHTNGILCSTKKNEQMIQTTTWMNPKCMVLGERSQTQKVTYYMSPFTKWEKQDSRNRQIRGCQELGVGEGATHRGMWENLWVWWNCSRYCDGYITEWVCQNSYYTMQKFILKCTIGSKSTLDSSYRRQYISWQGIQVFKQEWN